MADLVISYPKVSESDYNWIQDYRSKFDRKYYSVVKPHLTFVFPVSDIREQEFIEEIERQSALLKKFDIEFKVATINYDPFGKYYHEFLVPETGYAEVVKAHDRLYSGALRKVLRLDIDFIPHMGIGNAEKVEESKIRVDELNSKPISVCGSIDALDIVRFENDTVSTIKQISLQ